MKLYSMAIHEKYRASKILNTYNNYKFVYKKTLKYCITNA